MYFGIMVLEQVVNIALRNRRFKIQIGLALDRLVMDYVAWWGRSLRKIGPGNDLMYPQGLCTT